MILCLFIIPCIVKYAGLERVSKLILLFSTPHLMTELFACMVAVILSLDCSPGCLSTLGPVSVLVGMLRTAWAIESLMSQNMPLHGAMQWNSAVYPVNVVTDDGSTTNWKSVSGEKLKTCYSQHAHTSPGVLLKKDGVIKWTPWPVAYRTRGRIKSVNFGT